MNAEIITFPVGLYQCNCSIIFCRESKEAIVIDPGSEPETILAKLHDQGLTVKAIIHTHAHLDHFGATQDIHEETKAPVRLHKEDSWLWSIADEQAAMLGIPKCRHAKVDQYIEDEEIKFGQFTIQALHTPGHSSGSMCFKIDDGQEQHLFSGDTLFNRSVGRTDLPTGDSATLQKSIKQRLYTLDSDTKVVPGHGPSTIIGEEKRSNPFVRV